MAAAFDHIYTRTGERMAAATAGKRGIAALHAYIHEILPLEPISLDEARVVIPFWHQALTTPALAARHEQAIAVWRDQICTYLAEAREDGHVDAAVPDEPVVGLLLTALLGAQVTERSCPTPGRPTSPHSWRPC